METTYRHWLMLKMISRSPRKIDGATIEARLRDEGYPITRRTIQRDLEKLATIFPLGCDDRNRPYGWSWQQEADGFAVPGMEPAAALTLQLVNEHLTALLPPSAQTSIQPYIAEAGRVLDRLSGNPLRNWPDKVRVIPSGQPLRPVEIDMTVLNAVYEGLLQERRLRVAYRRRGEEDLREYEVSPLGLVSKERLLYLVGTIGEHSTPVLLVPHRMASAILLETPVTPPAEFSLDDYLARGELQFAKSDRMLRLEVCFSQEAGNHLLEMPLSVDQIASETRDGRLRIKATVLDTRQLRWWLLGFGDAVEVIGPKSLRQEFAATVAALSARYSTV